MAEANCPNGNQEILIQNIPTQWRIFLDQNRMLQLLRETLAIVYGKHLRNGQWYANPGRDEIFSWMTCPPQSVRAIILLMEPLPYFSNPNFVSTGYAFGVRRQPGSDTDIRLINTVWNMFEILHLFKGRIWDSYAEDRMRAKYSNGFNPEFLSRNGFLFFNVGLTKGLGCDIDDWWKFFKHLMKGLDNNTMGKIPILQFYNNVNIQSFLAKEDMWNKFSVYKPGFMTATADKTSHHICEFNKNHSKTAIRDYVAGLQNEEHRDIMEELAEEVLNGSHCVA